MLSSACLVGMKELSASITCARLAGLHQEGGAYFRQLLFSAFGLINLNTGDDLL
jgi:hypothetical protein